MDDSKHLGRLVKQLACRIARQFPCPPTNDVTVHHGRIIGYLWHNRDKDIFQRDIEKEFGIRRSTATRLLQLMESNGLILREQVMSDARLKKIVLTPKAVEMEQGIHKVIDSFEEELAQAFTPEEEREFRRLVGKLNDKLLEMEQKKQIKEGKEGITKK